jgi:hypothetical protein
MVIEPRRLLTVHLVIIAGLVLANVPIAVMDGMGITACTDIRVCCGWKRKRIFPRSSRR